MAVVGRPRLNLLLSRPARLGADGGIEPAPNDDPTWAMYHRAMTRSLRPAVKQNKSESTWPGSTTRRHLQGLEATPLVVDGVMY